MRVIGDATLYLGDCLEVMAQLPDASVDMVLCDLPYGTTACKWDAVIPFEPLWAQYRRICKPNAAIVLTAAQPFTSALVMSNPKMFRYEWIWRKNMGSGFASARFQPMRYHESVLVFYAERPTYNPQPTLRNSEASIRACQRPIRSGASKSNHTPMSAVVRQYDAENKGPESVLSFNSVPNGGGHKLHPTQKPAPLCEYLIRTYSNAGDTVLDNTMGSGTTAVAAFNTGRKCIGIEREPTYFDIACQRVLGAISQPDLLAA